MNRHLDKVKLDNFPQVNNDRHDLASSWKIHICDVIVLISDRGWNNHELVSFPKTTIYFGA